MNITWEVPWLDNDGNYLHGDQSDFVQCQMTSNLAKGII